MQQQFTKRIGLLGLMAGVLFTSLPTASHASLTIAQGWDLFQTVSPGTTFAGVDFSGVPLGSFDFTTGTGGDFGRGLGVLPTGMTDTIVKRLDVASVSNVGDTATIRTQMEALQLETSAPANLGAGVGNYFITLQSDRSAQEGGPGTATDGQMAITFGPEGNPHGTFSSFFDVFYDVRFGSLNGPIVDSGDLNLTSSNVPWSHDPQAGAELINGANFWLDGNDDQEDFFPGFFTEKHPNGPKHVVHEAEVGTPEPSSVLVFAIGLLFLGAAIKRRAVKN